ncbi:hypothetical protein SteCoe_22781 [Stentor coeruleus]|uniref:Uncharacterized protein n=1 Tax=Stentor coeruleus TaxID=5963 RepID=A0A1R2BLB0_9CILI|nr:hypothetical protein SteCoe_22781 [Stentor coeruleus]
MILKDITSGIFRFIHITSGCFLIGNSVSDVIWSGRDESIYMIAYITFGLALLISGVINIILLNPSQILSEKPKKLWLGFIYGKALVWILFIPIPDLITEATGHVFPRKEFNSVLVLISLILSITAKTFRDQKSHEG